MVWLSDDYNEMLGEVWLGWLDRRMKFFLMVVVMWWFDMVSGFIGLSLVKCYRYQFC